MTEEERRECPPFLQLTPPASFFSMNQPQFHTPLNVSATTDFTAVPLLSVIYASAASRIRSQELFKCKCFHQSAFGLFAFGTCSLLLQSNQLSCYQESILISDLQSWWDTDWGSEARGHAPDYFLFWQNIYSMALLTSESKEPSLKGGAGKSKEKEAAAGNSRLRAAMTPSFLSNRQDALPYYSLWSCPISPIALTLLKMTDVQTAHTKDSQKWFESNSVLATLGDRLQEEVLNPTGNNWCFPEDQWMDE